MRARRFALALLAALALALLAGVRPDLTAASLSPRYASPASRFALVDGVMVHYRDEGTGPPLVLIHGTSSSLHTWDGWVARLSDHRRVIRLDLPGFGLTGPAADRDYSAARYARVVVALLDRLGVARADVAGNSLGGRVALTLALAHPTRVRGLVLVDAAGLRGQKKPAVFRLAQTPVLNRLLRWVTPRTLVRRNIEQVYGDPARVTDALVDRHHELLRREGNRQALLDRLNGPVDPDLDDRLAGLRGTVLIEWGDADRWIPVGFARRLHRGIAGAQLVIYPGGGHVPMEELPGPTSTDADRFLAAIGQ